MQLFLVVLAILAGASIPVQAGMNVQAAKALPSPLHASLLSFVMGTLTVIVMCLGARTPVPRVEHLASMPWWAWGGGVIGAGFVASTVLLAPRLGVLLFLAAAILGQMVASAIIDHYGWVGLEARALTPGRWIGVGLMLAGVACIKWL
ncbi:MAG: hypothetical protein HBSAPP03_17600 [Phycisphaerae bacterium]|nr:MAG: hypothetical protein HBSAPP03_17600 [Phycisphaerae bacterium]